MIIMYDFDFRGLILSEEQNTVFTLIWDKKNLLIGKNSNNNATQD